MKKEKWIAIILGLLLLLSYPFYFLYFIDYRVAGTINNDTLITVILFIPFIIDAIILLACRGRDISRPRTYRVLYFSNLLLFTSFTGTLSADYPVNRRAGYKKFYLMFYQFVSETTGLLSDYRVIF